MKVSDILRVKGDSPMFTITPLEPLALALKTMAERDMGSLVVMDHDELAGMLTFREVIQAIHRNGGEVGESTVRSAMDDHPLTCSPDTELDEVRREQLLKLINECEQTFVTAAVASDVPTGLNGTMFKVADGVVVHYE